MWWKLWNQRGSPRNGCDGVVWWQNFKSHQFRSICVALSQLHQESMQNSPELSLCKILPSAYMWSLDISKNLYSEQKITWRLWETGSFRLTSLYLLYIHVVLVCLLRSHLHYSTKSKGSVLVHILIIINFLATPFDFITLSYWPFWINRATLF